jgi:tight adherence protein B
VTGSAASLVACLLAGAAVALLLRPDPARRLLPRRDRATGGPGSAGTVAGGPVAGPPVARDLWAGVRAAVARPRGSAGGDLDAVVTVVDRLAALVRAGLAPRVAWDHLAAVPGPMRPVCALVAETVATGGAAADALRDAATLVRSGRARRWPLVLGAPGAHASRARAGSGRAAGARAAGGRATAARVERARVEGARVEGARVEGARRLPREVGRTGAAAAAADAGAVLGWLAVTVAVSERTGAPLAACLERLAAAVRAEAAAADERASALAGPRATAQVLGWLPAAGIGLGALVGADPVHALLTTAPGRLCAAAGTALWLAGRLWSAALVRAAARAGE